MTAIAASTRPSIMGERYIREREIIQILPISRATWWAGVKSRKFPAGIKLSPRVTVWRASDIEALMANLAAE